MSRKRAPLEGRLAEVRDLDVAALRAAWADEFGRPAPARLSRDLLVRAIAYRIQERRGGGLRPATLRRLNRLAEDLQNGRETESAPPSPLQPGVRLMREWNGETHVVDVLADGFAWRGASYASLSAIARAITGVRWSGPRFFGLLDKRAAKDSDPFIREQGNRT